MGTYWSSSHQCEDYKLKIITIVLYAFHVEGCQSSHISRSRSRTMYEVKWPVLQLCGRSECLTIKFSSHVDDGCLAKGERTSVPGRTRISDLHNAGRVLYLTLRDYHASWRKSLAKHSQNFNAKSYNIAAWCCDMRWTGWPNARSILNATCGCLWSPGPWHTTR